MRRIGVAVAVGLALAGGLAASVWRPEPAQAQSGEPTAPDPALLDAISFDTAEATASIDAISAMMRQELAAQDLTGAQRTQVMDAIADMRPRMYGLRAQLESALLGEVSDPQALPSPATVPAEPTSQSLMIGLETQLSKMEAMGMQAEADAMRAELLERIGASFDAWEAGVDALEQDLSP